MKLLYTGQTPTTITLKRLMLSATEIGFCDRPSILFGQHGFVGSRSSFTGSTFGSNAIKLSTHAPPDLSPSATEDNPYKVWLREDVNSVAFRQAVLDGLRDDIWFSLTLLHPTSEYRTSTGKATGADVAHIISTDPNLLTAPIDLNKEPRAMFDIATSQGRVDTFRVLLENCSAHLTGNFIVADRTGFRPVTSIDTVRRLMSIRSEYSTPRSSSETFRGTLAIEVSRAVIPDDVLEQLDFSDILKYREATQESYDRCMVEINRLAATIGDVSEQEAVETIKRTLNIEVMPQVRRYRDDLQNVRDEMFAKLLRKAVNYAVPTLALATAGSSPMAGTIAATLAAGACGVLPELFDSLMGERNARRRCPLAYFVDATK